MLAGLMGEERNAYWTKPNYQDLKVGVQITKSPKIMGIKMNYWRSKTTTSLGKNLSRFILPGGLSDILERGFTTQVKFDYLQDVSYRIFIDGDSPLIAELARRVRERKFYYPPYLGHANLLAEIEYVGEFDAELITEGNFVSLVPTSLLDKSYPLSKLPSLGVFEIYLSVPTSYAAEKSATVQGKDYFSSIPQKFENILVPKPSLQIRIERGYGLRLQIDGKPIDVVVS